MHSRVTAAGTVQSRGLAGVGPSSLRFWESEFLSDFKVSSADLKSNREICLQGCDLPLLIENQIFFQIFKVEAVQCNAVKAPPPLVFSLLQIFSTWHCHKFQNDIVRAFGIMISLLQIFSTRYCHNFKIIFKAFGIMISPLLQIVSTQHSYQGSMRSQKWFARLLSFPVAFKTKSGWKWQHQVEAR